MGPIPMNTDSVSRQEYEIRHAELRTEVLREIVDLEQKISDMSGKLTALTHAVERNSTDSWKLIATTVLGIMAGFIAGYFSYLLH